MALVSSKTKTHLQRLIIGFALAAAMIVGSGLAAAMQPGFAFANYNEPGISTIAQVQTNGSLHVVEQRSYAFDEPYKIITWKISGLPSDVEIQIDNMRLAQLEHASGDLSEAEEPSNLDAQSVQWINLAEVSFKSSWRDLLSSTEGAASAVDEYLATQVSAGEEGLFSLPQEPSWAFDRRDDTIYIFASQLSSDGDVLIEGDYVAENAMFVYDDVAELYWDYVSTSDCAVSNVDVSIQLPVPENMPVVPGDNIRGWGHGPQGDVTISPDGVIRYEVARVQPGQYAQAHVIFPASWLINLPREMKIAHSGNRKDAVIEEEAQWTDTWVNSQVNAYTIQIAVLGICFVLILAALIVCLVFRRKSNEGKALSASDAVEPHLLDLPPSVAGRLVHWNMEDESDLVASLMDLDIKGIVSANWDASAPHDLEKVAFRITPSAKTKPLSEFERHSLNLWFDKIGGEYETITVHTIKSFASRHPMAFLEAIDEWNSELKALTAKEHLFDLRAKRAQRALMYAGAACVLLGIVSIFLIEAWCLIPFISAVVIFVLENYTGRYSEKGQLLASELEEIPQKVKDGTEFERYAPYAFESMTEEKLEELYASLSHPTNIEQFWFDPRKDEFGRKCSNTAWLMTEMLDSAVRQAQD